MQPGRVQATPEQLDARSLDGRVRDIRAPQWLAAVVSGCCMWLAAPGFDYWWLSFVAWCPLFWACRQQRLRARLALGWVTGFVAVMGGYTWLTHLLERFAGFSPPVAWLALVGFSLYQGAMWGLPAGLLGALQPSPGSPRATHWRFVWTAPLAWVVIEWPLPQLFEVHIGYFWARQPLLIQHAELGGALLVSATMLAINGAIFDLWLRWSEEIAGRPWPRVFASRSLQILGLLVVTIVGFGAWRMQALDTELVDAPRLKVGVAQGNFGIKTRGNRGMRAQLLADLQRETAGLEADGAQFVMWGETSYPYGRWPRNASGDRREGHPRRVRKGFSVPVVFGTAMIEQRSGESFPRIYNTVLALDGEGRDVARYDKHKPLMFGEWVPLVDPDWYRRNFPRATMIERGAGPGTLEIQGQQFGALICYEDLLPKFVADTVELDVVALLNFTNDSWFGGSRAPGHHLALAVLRSVETRRSLVRAVNAGISAHIDPLGRITHELPLTHSDADGYRGPDGFVADIILREPEHRTLFVTVGDGWGVAAWIGLLFALYRRRKHGQVG